MAIIRPTLPPKAGYVEVEVNGIRTYKNVITGILIENEIPTLTIEERVTTLEDQVAQADEIAIELYESQATQDEALIELYEMIGG